MYAILETGGKQYRVEAGATLQVEALDAEEGQTVELKPVRFISDDKGGTIGQPEINTRSLANTGSFLLDSENHRLQKLVLFGVLRCDL